MRICRYRQIGFLFVIIYYRGGSLIPYIIAHSVINIADAFANEAGLTPEKFILLSAIQFIIVVAYILILLKTLPKKNRHRAFEHERRHHFFLTGKFFSTPKWYEKKSDIIDLFFISQYLRAARPKTETPPRKSCVLHIIKFYDKICIKCFCAIECYVSFESVAYMKKYNKGFTLIELIIVLAILAILAALALPSFNSLIAKSRTSVCDTNRATLERAYLIERVVDTTGTNEAVLEAAKASITGENASACPAPHSEYTYKFYTADGSITTAAVNDGVRIEVFCNIDGHGSTKL